MALIVYYTWVPDTLAPALEDQWLRGLPHEKSNVLRRMHFDKNRAGSLLGLQLLRRGVESLGFKNFDTATLSFPRGGKPYCDLPIDFNISHSKDIVICAFSTGSAKIGVDIEHLRGIRIGTFQRFLDHRERAWIGEDKRRFFKLWTQKEAVIKGHGKGGIANLRKVKITRDKGAFDAQTWTLRELNIHPNYMAHVAVDRDEILAVEVRYVVIND
jgi:4'-phosphopantetheinyl transferase